MNEAAEGQNITVDANYYYNQAEDSLVKRKSQAAKEAFQRALRLNPVHLDAYHRLALTEFNLGNVKEAKEWWEKSLRIAKGNATTPPLVTDDELKKMYYHRGLMNETLQHKIKHDYEQVNHSSRVPPYHTARVLMMVVS